MISLLFCIAAVALFGIGRLWARSASARRTGGAEYSRKRERKTQGQTLYVVAGLLLVLALINFFLAGKPTVPEAPPDNVVISEPTAPQSPAPPPAVPAGENIPHHEPAPAQELPATNPPPLPVAQEAVASPAPASAESGAQPSPAMAAARQKEMDDEMTKAQAILKDDPSNIAALDLRGNIYVMGKKWDLAVKDYQRILEIDGKNAAAAFNLAEVDFQQKHYDKARAGFDALKNDPDLGDLAAYKTFLCDLAGGHEDAAARELDAFNQVGSHASYYFANAAWEYSRQKPDSARDWLASAFRIYTPAKVRNYATGLIELGYIPISQEQL